MLTHDLSQGQPLESWPLCLHIFLVLVVAENCWAISFSKYGAYTYWDAVGTAIAYAAEDLRQQNGHAQTIEPLG